MLYPKPKFKIGQVVRLKENTDPGELAVVSGLELEWFDHFRSHRWYYKLVDHQGLVGSQFTEKQIEAATAETENQKWYVTGGEVPLRPMITCWNCKEVRIEDDWDCPYCSADYEPDVLDKETACKIARDLGLDDAIRTVTRYTASSSNRGINYYAKFENLELTATFGAGTNSASVWVDNGGQMRTRENTLYRAGEYGKYIEKFRYGPWVHRLLFEAGKIRKANEAQAEIDEAKKIAFDTAKFAEVDF